MVRRLPLDCEPGAAVGLSIRTASDASSTVSSGVPSSSQNCSELGKKELHSGQRFINSAPGRSYRTLRVRTNLCEALPIWM